MSSRNVYLKGRTGSRPLPVRGLFRAKALFDAGERTGDLVRRPGRRSTGAAGETGIRGRRDPSRSPRFRAGRRRHDLVAAKWAARLIDNITLGN